MDPASAVVIAKAAIAAGSSKKARTGTASVIAALCLPVILIIVCLMSVASGGADHNRAAVRFAFRGGDAGAQMPADYREYIAKMQESFAELDTVLDRIEEVSEGEPPDRDLVRAVFYALYFGENRVRLDAEDYVRFADCFVDYEERTRLIEHEDGSTGEETYTAAVAVTNKVEIFNNIKNDYGKATTYEQQSNAVNVWYLAKYDTAAPQEGDGFDDWHGWNMPEETAYYDLPASEAGKKVVELAMSRLGDPYSQNYRGRGSYVDLATSPCGVTGRQG